MGGNDPTGLLNGGTAVAIVGFRTSSGQRGLLAFWNFVDAGLGRGGGSGTANGRGTGGRSVRPFVAYGRSFLHVRRNCAIDRDHDAIGYCRLCKLQKECHPEIMDSPSQKLSLCEDYEAQQTWWISIASCFI